MNRNLENWENTNLGSLLRNKKKKGYKEEELLSVTGENGVVRRNSLERRDTSNNDKSKYLLVEKGDIAYNTMRMWQGVSGVSFHRGIVSPAYTVCFPTNKIDSIFAGYLLKDPLMISLFRKRSQGLVSDTWNLKYENFAKIPCSIPSLPEQRKITEIISGIDQSINTHKQQRNKLSLLFRGLLYDHFSQTISNSKLMLDDILSKPIQYGANASATKLLYGSPRYLRITDINDNGLLIDSCLVGIDMDRSEYINYLLIDGDILLARTGNTVGKSYLHSEANDPLVFAGYLLRLSVQIDIYQPAYLFLYTQSDIYKRWVINSSRAGAQPNINAKEYGGMKIPHASIKEQKSFIDSAMHIRKHIFLINQKIRKLIYFKKAISSDLLSGRNRVSV